MQKFRTETGEIYRGFEINSGQLINGEEVFEAYHKDLAFYRKTKEQLKDAIDRYSGFVSEGLVTETTEKP